MVLTASGLTRKKDKRKNASSFRQQKSKEKFNLIIQKSSNQPSQRDLEQVESKRKKVMQCLPSFD